MVRLALIIVSTSFFIYHMRSNFCCSLEEYLQELTGLSGSQLQLEKSGDTIPNFAHAALILQNSSHVYSRKVEYLHGLVYKALYEFFQTSTAKESRRKSADASIDDFYEFDPNEDFLLLDDVVPEDFTNTKINLKDDELETIDSASTPVNQSFTRTRVSLGGLSVSRAERSSLGGYATTSQQRALLGTLNNGSLRLVDGLCDVGEDGILLMPGSQSALSTATVVEDQMEGGRSLFTEDDVAEGNYCDDRSDDGPGFEMNDDNDGDGQAQIIDNVVEVGTTQNAAREVFKRVTFADTAIQVKRADPWMLLDPHSSEGFTPKPLRKGKTYRLPEGITLPPSECVTGASTRRVVSKVKSSKQEIIYIPLIVQTLQAFLGKREDPPKIPIDGLIFGDEFLYLAKESAKARAAERRAERKKFVEHQAQAAFDDDDDDDQYGCGFDTGGEDDNDDGDDAGNAGMTSLDEAYLRERSALGGTSADCPVFCTNVRNAYTSFN